MQNLAGDKESDKVIRRELERCRIAVIKRAVPEKGEVPQTITGDLPGFRLRRAWYYWVVSGCVPLAVAQELYADPVGKSDVRVAGHCGCPPPEGWVEWVMVDGKKTPFVTSYHIDSEIGLRLFVDTLRKHGVVPSENR